MTRGINLSITKFLGGSHMAVRREKTYVPGALFRIREAIGLPLEAVTGAFRLETVGGRELTIENCTGILEYTEECLRASVKGGVVTVRGSALMLKALSGDGIFVTGAVRAVEFLEA